MDEKTQSELEEIQARLDAIIEQAREAAVMARDYAQSAGSAEQAEQFNALAARFEKAAS